MDSSYFKLIMFLSIGGITVFLPIVIMGMLTTRTILTLIGYMLAIVLGVVAIYVLVGKGNILVDVLLLKESIIFLPKRTLGIPYVLIFCLVAMLPISIFRSLLVKRKSKPE